MQQLDGPATSRGGYRAGPPVDNVAPRRLILGIAIVSALIYLGLSRAGDLRASLPTLFTAQGALLLLMLGAWRAGRAGRYRRIVIGAAVAFRLIAAVGPPALSDDVHRYVWDGRVQLHGNSPYRYAPDDPALAELRDESWGAINHPELKTIYPPLAQGFFLMLAAVGAGPIGFKLAMAALDVGVVLALSRLLERCALPADRLILYAWNPLAILETAGSGHVEPLGVAPIILAAAWIIDRRRGLSTTALGAAIHAKLLPLVLLPSYMRRVGWRQWLPLILLVALLLPFAVPDPSGGSGLTAYAERWERNALLFSLVREGLEAIDADEALKRAVVALEGRLEQSWIPWDFLYRHVWPPYIARLLVALAGLAWIVWLTRGRRRPIVRESLLVLGGILLLSPTLHPWYLLWLLPFAAALLSWPWLLLAALIPLAYWGGDAEVPWLVRAAEYLPPLGVAVWLALRRRARRLETG